MQRRDGARAALAHTGSDSAGVLVRVLDADMIISMVADGTKGWIRVGDERVAAARAYGDAYELSRALASLAAARCSVGEDTRALAAEALEVARTTGNPTAICSGALTLGQATVPFDLTASLLLLDEAERAGVDAGNESLVNVVQGIRGEALYTAGDVKTAVHIVLANVERQAALGYMVTAYGYLLFVAGALAAAGYDEAAAKVHGYAMTHTPAPFFAIDREKHRPDLDALSERLGTDRYARLIDAGTTLPDVHAAVAIARAAIQTSP
jgi:hypothetical protein